MRKRDSKPKRFEMVDREAIQDIPSILATGVLNHLIAARDGDDVTVSSLAAGYSEGERVLEKAMRVLVDDGRVVKFKIQHARTVTVVDEKTGEETSKRGGSWRTEFSVDAHGSRFTPQDVADMYEEILAEGNVKAMRVEPERLDPRKNGLRPTPQNRGVGPTSSDTENPQVGPTPRFAGVGRPGVGNRGALYRNETVSRDSLCDAGDETATEAGAEAVTGEREAATPEDKTAPEQEPHQSDSGATDFLVALPGQLGRLSVESLAPLVVAATAEGVTPHQLRRHLLDRVDVNRIKNPAAIPTLYRRALEDLPAAWTVVGADAGPVQPRCVNHPAYAAEHGDLCAQCHGEKLAAADAPAPATEDALDVDVEALRRNPLGYLRQHARAGA